ncbi:hypothetical protein KCU81_g594, partial [Aureobasidium melanogenum]
MFAYSPEILSSLSRLFCSAFFSLPSLSSTTTQSLIWMPLPSTPSSLQLPHFLSRTCSALSMLLPPFEAFFPPPVPLVAALAEVDLGVCLAAVVFEFLCKTSSVWPILACRSRSFLVIGFSGAAPEASVEDGAAAAEGVAGPDVASLPLTPSTFDVELARFARSWRLRTRSRSASRSCLASSNRCVEIAEENDFVGSGLYLPVASDFTSPPSIPLRLSSGTFSHAVFVMRGISATAAVSFSPIARSDRERTLSFAASDMRQAMSFDGCSCAIGSRRRDTLNSLWPFRQFVIQSVHIKGNALIISNAVHAMTNVVSLQERISQVLLTLLVESIPEPWKTSVTSLMSVIFSLSSFSAFSCVGRGGGPMAPGMGEGA